MSSCSWASQHGCQIPPGSQIVLWSYPSTPSIRCCCCFYCPTAMEGSPLLSFSLLTTSTDLIINLIISSIILSSCSQVWLSFFSLLCCTSSLQMGRSNRSHMPSSSSMASNFHPTANFSSAVLSSWLN
jgi:hypothetical protein